MLLLFIFFNKKKYYNIKNFINRITTIPAKSDKHKIGTISINVASPILINKICKHVYNIIISGDNNHRISFFVIVI